MALFKGSKAQDPQSFLIKKQYDKAIKLYLEQLEKKPDDLNCRLRLADAYSLDSQKSKAIESYKKVADEYAEQGFLLKAIGVNKKIVKLDPAQKDVHLKLSKLYEERGLISGPSGIPKEAFISPGRQAESKPAPSPEIAVEELPVDVSIDELAGALSMQPEPGPFGKPEAEPLATEDVSADDLAIEDVDEAGAGAPSRPTRTPLFSDMRAEELAEVMAIMTQKSFGKGETIVEEGAPGDSLFVIVEGQVGVSTKTPKGEEIRLATMKDGEFFGEISLLIGKPRTATITTEKETEVLELNKAQLDDVVKKYPRVQEVMEQFYEVRAQRTIEIIRSALKK
ncbi:cyclic nucleotide-binding domain-containing protein [Acidobacteriota bacterium]